MQVDRARVQLFRVHQHDLVAAQDLRRERFQQGAVVAGPGKRGEFFQDFRIYRHGPGRVPPDSLHVTDIFIDQHRQEH